MIELGIDVSEAQASVDWRRVRDQGYKLALIRSTQGGRTSIPVGVDRRFHQHIDGALNMGMLTGVYHAFLGGRDGREQADFFLEQTRAYRNRLALPLAVDVEVSNGQSAVTVANRLYDMLRCLEDELYYKALIYTSWGFWSSCVWNQHDDYFAQHHLWVANYTNKPGPVLPRCWRTWVIWQYSSVGQVAGVSSEHVDLNRFADGWADTLAVG